jgi:hypothetical protein
MNNMQSFNGAIERLIRLKRYDLGTLLRNCKYAIVKEDERWDFASHSLEISAPKPVMLALKSLYEFDKKKIIDAVKATDPKLGTKDTFENEIYIIRDRENVEIEPRIEVLAQLILQRETLRSIGMGEARIQECDDDYILRHEELKDSFESWQLDYSIPYEDLWDWYKYYRDNIGTYAERRKYLSELFEPLVKTFAETLPDPLITPREPTGWERVDRALRKARGKLSTGVNEEDFQEIGLLCREILISLAQEVYNPDIHKTYDGVSPSDTDASRMIIAFLSHVVGGKSNETKRKYAKASTQLAAELQHKRTASFRDAAFCLEATSSMVNTCAILSGIRDLKKT